MNIDFLIQATYIIASVLFAFGLKFLGSPETARRGNHLSAFEKVLDQAMGFEDLQFLLWR